MSSETRSKTLTSAFSLFGKSANAVQANLALFVILSLPYFVFSLLDLAFGSSASNPEPVGNTGMSGAVTALVVGVVIVAMAIMVLLLETMLTKLQLEASVGKQPGLKELWPTAKKYWLRLLGLYLAAGAYILLGLLLLIVPGLIMFRRYFLAPYFLIDKDLKIGEAMRQSANASKPYSGYVWSVIGVTFLLSLSGLIPIVGGLITLILEMLYSVAPAYRYQELKNAAKS